MKDLVEEWKVYKTYSKGRNKTKTVTIEVSNFGRIRDNGILREPKVKENSYIKVGSERLHVVVAKLFIPNPENKPFIDHIDRNKHNNRVDNLRWCTPKENANNPNTIEAHKNAAKQRWIDYKDSYKNVGYTKGHESHNKGKHLSEETKRKLSEANKGKPSFWKGKVGPRKGKKMSEETKAKISNSHKGRHWYIGEDGKRHY